MRRYIKADRSIAERHRGQLQLLMHMSRRKRAFFCVADPAFGETGDTVHIVMEEYEPTYCQNLMAASLDFWKSAVFPQLWAGVR